MKFIFYLFAYLLYSSISLAEKVPAGYVAKWDTSYLTELDYKIKNDNSCQSFEGILQKGRLEMPHIIPFKIINRTLTSFINGYDNYNDNNKNENPKHIDTVVIWPNYEQSNWYVLMGSNSCFISWIEIQPDNLDVMISSGSKL